MASYNSTFSKSGPLTDDQIRKVAPSIFSEREHQDCSDRYSFIPTIDILSGLRENGFEPFMAAQCRTNIAGRENFTSHMLRLRRDTNNNRDKANEIVLYNSHDRSKSLQLTAGVIRFACWNGLVVGDDLTTVKVKHVGEAKGQVIEGAFTVLNGFDEVDEDIDLMKSTPMNRQRQLILAEAALQLKYDEENPAPIHPSALLTLHRTEDKKEDLWTTFNVIQENMIRGGLRGRSSNGRRTRTREVTSIDNNIKLNKALWTLSTRMAEQVN